MSSRLPVCAVSRVPIQQGERVIAIPVVLRSAVSPHSRNEDPIPIDTYVGNPNFFHIPITMPFFGTYKDCFQFDVDKLKTDKITQDVFKMKFGYELSEYMNLCSTRKIDTSESSDAVIRNMGYVWVLDDIYTALTEDWKFDEDTISEFQKDLKPHMNLIRVHAANSNWTHAHDELYAELYPKIEPFIAHGMVRDSINSILHAFNGAYTVSLHDWDMADRTFAVNMISLVYNNDFFLLDDETSLRFAKFLHTCKRRNILLSPTNIVFDDYDEADDEDFYRILSNIMKKRNAKMAANKD